MISCSLTYKGITQEFFLPAVPSIGSHVYIGIATVLVEKVTFMTNSNTVHLN